MRTRTRKKDRERFLSTVIGLLLNLGAQQDDDHFVLQTKAGRLTLYPNVYGSNELGTVFARFDDPNAAVQLVDYDRLDILPRPITTSRTPKIRTHLPIMPILFCR